MVLIKAAKENRECSLCVKMDSLFELCVKRELLEHLNVKAFPSARVVPFICFDAH